MHTIAQVLRKYAAPKNPLLTKAGNSRFWRRFDYHALKPVLKPFELWVLSLYQETALREHLPSYSIEFTYDVLQWVWKLHSEGMPLPAVLRKDSPWWAEIPVAELRKAFHVVTTHTNPRYESFYGPYDQRVEHPIEGAVREELLGWYRSPAFVSWVASRAWGILQKYSLESLVKPPKKEGLHGDPTEIAVPDTLKQQMAAYVAEWKASGLKADRWLLKKFGRVHTDFVEAWAENPEHTKPLIKDVARMLPLLPGDEKRKAIKVRTKRQQYILASYAITQTLLAKGYPQRITLYRGIRADLAAELREQKVGKQVNVVQRSLSSWTVDKKVARHFAKIEGSGGMVWQAVFPRSRVFSFYKMFSFSAHNVFGTKDAAWEKEFIILDGRYSVHLVR